MALGMNGEIQKLARVQTVNFFFGEEAIFRASSAAE
jgi:hypothetical protein